VVGSIRAKTTVPATKAARAVVFGLVAATLAVVALVLLVVAVLRLHVYLPFHPEARRVYVGYGAVGALFVLLGAVFWRKRAPRER